MTKLALGTHPFLLGVVQLERLVERTAKSGNEASSLVIRGRQSDDSEGRVFLHRGIAARQFQRSFVLADGVDVGEAVMENGLLHVDLTRAEPERIIQTINIKKG